VVAASGLPDNRRGDIPFLAAVKACAGRASRNSASESYAQFDDQMEPGPMNLMHTHNFIVPIGPILLLIGAVGVCVVVVRICMMGVGAFTFWLADRKYQREADAHIARLGALPRGVCDHTGGVNGVRPARVKEL
jgi:hypothetical protein